MTKQEIISILVSGFEEKLQTASDAILYSIYGEYLTQQEKLRNGEDKNEV